MPDADLGCGSSDYRVILGASHAGQAFRPFSDGMGEIERRRGGMPHGPIAVMIAHFKIRFRERVAEWMCAYIITWYGLIFLLPSRTFESPTYIPLARIASEDAWGYICLFVGVARFTVLIINGFWLPSYRLRSLFALMSIVFWMQLSLGAVFFNSQTVGVAIFPALLLGDLYAVYKAIVDYRLASAMKEAASASGPRASRH